MEHAVPQTREQAELADQVVVALTREQADMVRSLLYSELDREDDAAQSDFLTVIVDQIEQSMEV